MKRIFLFIFLLIPFLSKGQIVSGRIGVFKDSIYLNGVWYKSLGSGGIVTGSGTANYLPVFTGTNSIGNSLFNQSGSTLQGTNAKILFGDNKTFFWTGSGGVNQVGSYVREGLWVGSHNVGDNLNRQIIITTDTGFGNTSLYPGGFITVNYPGAGGYNPTVGLRSWGGNSLGQVSPFVTEVELTPTMFNVNTSDAAHPTGTAMLRINTTSPYYVMFNADNVYFNSISNAYSYGNLVFNLTGNPQIKTSGGISVNGAIWDSTLTVVGGGHFTGGLNVGGQINATGSIYGNNFVSSYGAFYARTSGYVSANSSSSSINSGDDVMAPNFWARMDTVFARSSYNLVSPNPVNVLIINNQLAVPDSVYIPSSSSLSTLTFTGGNRPSGWNGAARIIYLVNLTPSTGQPVRVFPQPGETLNGSTSYYTLPANSISIVTGLNGANVIK